MARLTISPAVEAKNTFSYIVMQVIWCVTFCNMTKSGGTIPPLQILGGLVSPSPVIYAHALREACGVAGCDFKFLLLL